MASSQAEARKPQVFTTATSAPAGSAWMVWPAAWTAAIICSQFTWFLAQPREIKETLYGTECTSMVGFLPGRRGQSSGISAPRRLQAAFTSPQS